MVVQMTRAQYEAKYGTSPTAPVASPVAPAPVVSAPTPTPITPTPSTTPASPVKMTRAQYEATYGTKPAVPEASVAPEPKGSTLGNMAKSLFSAPATLVARPIQLGAELFGASPESIDQFSKDKLGGVVAPLPKTYGDVKKDVGRAIETVALGTGAPISGGAAFGLGSSLEQGNDLFSTQALFDTALGAGLGKLTDIVGKPLLNTAGKVIGKITPKILKDVASKGTDAIAKFAADHQLLGGVAAPASEKIAKGFQAVDEKAGQLFSGAKDKAGEIITSQYPGTSKQAIQDHFKNVDKSNFEKPTTKLTEPGYKKANEIFEKAKTQGTNLADEAVNNEIQHDTLIDGKKYNTLDTAESLKNDAMKSSHDLIRPALAAAEPGVQKVPLTKVRERMLSEANSIPASKITDAERKTMIRRINAEYGLGSPADIAHPDGYSLTDLHDAKISHSANGKYTPFGTPTQNFPARISRKQGNAFKTLLEDAAPKELKIKEFNHELEKKFQLADYLEALHGKKVPQGVVRKAFDLFGKVLGASAGSQLGGGLGGVAGYHIGGMLFNSFDNLSNPVKAAYLRGIEKTSPEVFKAFKDYIGNEETARLMRLALPAKGGTSAPIFAGAEKKTTYEPAAKIINRQKQPDQLLLPAPGKTTARTPMPKSIREFNAGINEVKNAKMKNPSDRRKLIDIYNN